MPASGCTVATWEVATEAVVAIKSFQEFHPVPVLIVCDKGTEQELAKHTFAHPVVVRALEKFELPAEVRLHNNYHRADAIFGKMDALEQAVNTWGDSCFFDADLLFLETLRGPLDCELALSHNLSEANGKVDQIVSYGAFNAGLLWTCNPNFAAWWRQCYLTDYEGQFYEQSLLQAAVGRFRTDYFITTHNYGFWRGDVGKRHVSSFHCHLSKGLDTTMNPYTLDKAVTLRFQTFQYVGRHSKKVMEDTREALGHPKKVFFVHYGKSAGVYVNEQMKSMLTGYEMFDGYAIPGRNSDWSSDELTNILRNKGKDRPAYLHQQHEAIQPHHIQEARANGWKTFMFLRDPRDLIPAAFFWMKRTMETEGKNYLWPDHGHACQDWSLERHWYECIIRENRWLWSLPSWTTHIDHTAIFTERNFQRMCYEWFGYYAPAKAKMNASSNPGRKALCESGRLTQKMLRDLEATPEFAAFNHKFLIP
jgi:hypothetical protein